MSGPHGIFYGRMAVPSAAKGTLPPAGVLAFYIDSTDDHFKYIDSAATVVDLTDSAHTSLPDLTLQDATPTITFKDTDCTDSDDNCTLVVAATATGSGSEDIDVTLSAQKGGTLNALLTYDASADTTTVNRNMVTGGTLNIGGNVTVDDATDFVFNTSTGTKFGTATGQKIGFYNATPVVQASATTTALTTLTTTGATSDFAIQALVNSSQFGFVTANEGDTFVNVVKNIQVQQAEIVTILANLGFSA